MSPFIIIIISILQSWGSEIASYGTFVFRDLKQYKVMAMIRGTSPLATPFNTVKQMIMGFRIKQRGLRSA